MTELPSSLELESLSESELISRIAQVSEVIKGKNSLRGDESFEQKLVMALETEQSRRRVTLATDVAAAARLSPADGSSSV